MRYLEFMPTYEGNYNIKKNNLWGFSYSADCAVKTFRNEGFFGMYRGKKCTFYSVNSVFVLFFVMNIY